MWRPEWPAIHCKEKRAITLEEHQKIIATEVNPERKTLASVTLFHFALGFQCLITEGFAEVFDRKKGGHLVLHETLPIRNRRARIEIPEEDTSYKTVLARRFSIE